MSLAIEDSSSGRAARGERSSKGAQTRSRILEATLAVIARDGIRGVTHRAVAKEAAVNLSLTTYYFTDIDDMLKTAFQQFCERMRPDIKQLWDEIFTILDGYSRTELRRLQTRENLRDLLATAAAGYIITQIIEKPVGLVVEQIFFTEARLSPQLRQLGVEHRRQLLEPMVKLCGYFNRADPEVDAELLLDTITALEYQGAGMPREQLDRERIHALIRRQVGWTLGLKRA